MVFALTMMMLVPLVRVRFCMHVVSAMSASRCVFFLFQSIVSCIIVTFVISQVMVMVMAMLRMALNAVCTHPYEGWARSCHKWRACAETYGGNGHCAIARCTHVTISGGTMRNHGLRRGLVVHGAHAHSSRQRLAIH